MELTVKPSWRGGTRAVSSIAGSLVLLGFVSLYWYYRALQSGGRSDVLVIIGATAFICGLGAAIVALYFRNYRVFASADYFGRVGILGRRKVWERRSLKQVLLVNITMAPGSGVGSVKRYLFMSAGGKILAQIGAQRVDASQVRALCAILDVPIERRSDITTSADLAKLFPRSVSWWAKHPFLIGLGGSFVAFAILILVLVIRGD